MALGPNHIDDDAVLVTYLDGELDPERHLQLEERLGTDPSLRARLTALTEARRPLQNSFGALLEAAPRARLEAAFAAARARSSRRREYRVREILLAAAAALLLLIGGGVGGYFIAKAPLELFEEADGFEEAWIAAVAGQLSLYEGTAVAWIPVDGAELQVQLKKLGEELNLNLSWPRVTLEGLTLKRAELLSFQGRKVAQLLYASDEHSPIAFCIAGEPGGDGDDEVESRNGVSLIYWTTSDRRFLVIGAAPGERIEAIADTMRERFRS